MNALRSLRLGRIDAALTALIVGLVLLPVLPALAQHASQACSVAINGKSYAEGGCKVFGSHHQRGVSWSENGILYLNVGEDGTASGKWSGPKGDRFATIALPPLVFADGCWRGTGTAICYAGAAGDLAEAQAQAQRDQGTQKLLAVTALLLLLVYFVPAIIAFARRHPNRWVILIVNAVLGATVIVWLGCLVWALKAVHLSGDAQGTNGGASGLNIAADDIRRVRIEADVIAASMPLASSSGPIPNLIEDLKELVEMRAQGMLNDAEFQQFKGAVMAHQPDAAARAKVVRP